MNYKEEDHPRNADGTFAEKGGAIYEKRSEDIKDEDLDPNSDFIQHSKREQIDTDTLKAGDEYMDFNLKSNRAYPIDGYNLSTLHLVHEKSQYTDESDKMTAHEWRFYNDEGKHVTTRRVVDGFVTSEKRLNENGEFEEIPYTDEEHAIVMKEFLGYRKNYNGDDKKTWDNNQKARAKIPEIENLYHKKKPLEAEKREILNQMIEDTEKDSPERAELNKRLSKINRELEKVETDPKNDDISPIYISNMEDITRSIYRNYRNMNEPYGKEIPKDRLHEFTGTLSIHEKDQLDKFERLQSNLKESIKNGEVKQTGIKGDINDRTVIAYNDNQVRNNIAVMRAKVEAKKLKLDESDARMILRNDESRYDVADWEDEGKVENIMRDIKDKHGLNKEDEDYYRKRMEDAPKGNERDQAIKDFVDYTHRKEEGMSIREKKFVESIEHYVEVDNNKSYKNEKQKLAMFEARKGNEVISPLTEKNVHLYSIPDPDKVAKYEKTLANMLSFGKKSDSNPNGYTDEEYNVIANAGRVDPKVVDYAYKKAKETFTKNSWVRTSLGKRSPRNTDIPKSQSTPQSQWEEDGENRMHVQLNDAKGYKFKVAGKSFTAGGNWSESNEAINVFQATESAVEWIWNHELSHSQYDQIVQAVGTGALKNKKEALGVWQSETIKLDPKILEPILGNYATQYLKDYIEKPDWDSKKQMLHTEIYAGITDLKSGKEKGKYSGVREAYEALNNAYPNLVKSYETLKGAEDYNIYGESILTEPSIPTNNKLSYKKTIYLDSNENIVEPENANIIIVKGYTAEGRLITQESFFADDIATEFNEGDRERIPAGEPDGGQWVGDNNTKSYTKDLKERVKPNPKMRTLQEEVDEEIRGKVWKAIDDLGIKDKIDTVEMQGSFAKGTDLPIFEGDKKGSDLDLFVVFKSDIPETEREELGVKIGMRALEGKDPYIQNATSEYAEAFFDHKGEKMEVQIVPTRHLTREQIENKEYNGETISIGMERTPHQTAFMQKHLTIPMQEETRMLKKFMKETDLYDSSMKSQGFSGYSTEALIYNLGSFDNVVDYFANFKKGDILNKTDRDHDLGKGNRDNAFSLIDPIDKNRDLISAFSDMKIGRTIKTMQYFKEHGERPPKPEKVEMKGISITYDTTEKNEDTLAGQVRKTQKSIVGQLKKAGFEVPNVIEKVNGLEIQVDRTSQDRKKNTITMNFGIPKMDIPEEFPIIATPKMDIEKMNGRIETSPEGVTTVWRKREYTNAHDAISGMIKKGNVFQKTGVTDDFANGVKVNVKPNAEFENMF